MAAAITVLVACVLVVLVILVLVVEGTASSAADSQPSQAEDERPGDELWRLHNQESEVERISRETQEAIIKRAMWRTLWQQQESGKHE